MDHLGQAFAIAIGLILAADPELVAIVLLSLQVSLAAVALATLIGMPAGAMLALLRFPGRRARPCAGDADGGAAPGGLGDA